MAQPPRSTSRPPLRRPGPLCRLAVAICFITGCTTVVADDAPDGPASPAAALEAKPVRQDLDPPPGIGADRIRPFTGKALDRAARSIEAVLAEVDWPDELKRLGPSGRDDDHGGDGGGEEEPELSPAEAVKLYAAARHAAQSRQWETALQMLKKASSLDEGAARPRLLIGRIHAKLGRRASAIEALTAALQREPDNPEALYLLGRLNFERGNHRLAAKLLDRAVRNAGADADPDVTYLAGYFLGQALLRLDHDGAAAAALDRFLDLPRRLGRSEWHLRDLVLVSRQREIAHVQLGDALMRLGRPARAIEQYAEADLADRLGPAFVAGRRVYALMMLGRAGEAMGEAVAVAMHEDHDGRPRLIEYVAEYAADETGIIDPLRRTYEQSDRDERLALALAEVLPADEAGELLEGHLRQRPSDAAALERLARLWDADAADRLMRLAIVLMRQSPERAGSLVDALIGAAAQPGRWVEAVDDLPDAMKDGPSADYLKGRLLLAAGEPDPAARHFDAALEGSPEFLAARLAAVELLIDRAEQTGNTGRRAALLDRAIERLDEAKDDDNRLRFLRARALTGKGAYGEAAGELTPLLRSDGDRPEYRELKAVLLREVGQFDRAERTLLELVKDRPRRVSAYRALFELYERYRPNPQKFAQLVERAETTMPGGRLTRLKKARLLDMQGRSDEAITLLRNLVREDPDDGEALAAYTVAVGRSAGWPAAATKLESLLDVDPANEAALTMLESVAQLLDQPDRFYKRYEAFLKGQARTARTLGRLAALYERWGKVDEAIKVLDEALAFDPPAPGPFYLRTARLHQRAGRLPAALVAMEKAIAAEPDDPHYAVVKAWLLHEADRTDDAIRTLQAAERAHPEAAADLQLEQARVYAASEQHDKAMTLMDKLIAAHPDRAAELYYMQSLLPGGRATAAQTEKLLLKALEADPDYAPANNDLGYTWADAGRNLKRAERMVRKAVEAEPNNAAYLDSLGWVLYKRDLPGQAVRWLRRAAELRAGDPVILDHLGDAYWRAGEHEQAAEQWRTARKRIMASGEDLSEMEAELLGTVQSKLEAVDAGRAPAVAPIAEPESIDPGTSAVSP